MTFWDWFVRPFAELAAVFLIFSGLFVAMLACAFTAAAVEHWRKRK